MLSYRTDPPAIHTRARARARTTSAAQSPVGNPHFSLWRGGRREGGGRRGRPAAGAPRSPASCAAGRGEWLAVRYNPPSAVITRTRQQATSERVRRACFSSGCSRPRPAATRRPDPASHFRPPATRWPPATRSGPICPAKESTSLAFCVHAGWRSSPTHTLAHPQPCCK